MVLYQYLEDMVLLLMKNLNLCYLNERTQKYEFNIWQIKGVH